MRKSRTPLVQAAGVEAPSLLTSQPHASVPGTLVSPEGLQVLVSPRRSSSSPEIVQLLNSVQQRSVLKVNGEPVLRTNLQNKLAQFFQNRSDRTVQIEADGTFSFAAVVNLIDLCRSAGAKVVLATPTL